MAKSQRRFVRNISVIIITLLLLTQIIFITFWYNKTLNDTGFNAMTISRVVADSIKVKEYEAFLASKERNEYFEQMQEFFHRIQAENHVQYVYIEHKISPDKIEYIFDSEKDSLGETDEMYTPQAHSSLQSFHTRAQATELWGTSITGYAPIINEKGEVISVVGTDVDIHFIYNELAKRIGQIIVYTLAMVVLFSLLIYFTLSEEIRRRRLVENELNKSMLSIKNLLNNAGQGFLSFGSDLRIKPEYSLECQRLMGPDLENRFFPELIYSNDHEQKAFMEKVFSECFQEQDIERREIFLSFLPRDTILNNYNIEIEYKIIEDKHRAEVKAVMVILTDVTEKRELQEQMERERKTLKMIVKAVVNRNDILEIITDYLNFCHETVPNLLNCQEPLHIVLVDIKRSIHTFKGLFGQFEMTHIVCSLHRIEEQIKSFEQQESLNSADLGVFLQSFDLELGLNEDLTILQSTLGKAFLAGDKIVEIPESKLIELEEQITTHFSSKEATALIKKIRQLRYRLFKELLAGYPSYIESLAQRLEKGLYPLKLEGGEFPVDTIRYQAFTKSLLHIFANCLDHGIENRESRINSGKDERGKIICEMTLVDDKILLRIADDGKGIDIEGLKQKARNLGIYNEDELKRLKDSDIIPLIFEDGLSSKEQVSLFSGRGIGMAIVKRELEKIGGHLDIVTTPGMGTEFRFLLPV